MNGKMNEYKGGRREESWLHRREGGGRLRVGVLS